MGTRDRQAKLDNSALEMIRSISDGSDDLLQQVVALFIESTPPLLQDIEAGLSNNEMDRLRVCAADDCEGLLLDLSRNGLKRFCSVRCGNRMNMIAFRERKADGR